MSKSKKQIITFHMTKKETLRSKKFLVDSDSENEHEEQDENEDIQPVVMLQNIIPANTKIITSHNCMSDIFTYEKADVHVIKDEKGDYYYKAKSIAKILGYADCKKAISRHERWAERKRSRTVSSTIQTKGGDKDRTRP